MATNTLLTLLLGVVPLLLGACDDADTEQDLLPASVTAINGKASSGDETVLAL